MTVEEMQAQLDKMKDDIAHMEAKVLECEHMISMIAGYGTQVFFPSEEIAQKVCYILNKECENNEKS